MKPSQHVRLLLKLCGISQREAAKLLGVTDRTIARYCAQDGKAPRAVFIALLGLYYGLYVDNYSAKP